MALLTQRLLDVPGARLLRHVRQFHADPVLVAPSVAATTSTGRLLGTSLPTISASATPGSTSTPPRWTLLILAAPRTPTTALATSLARSRSIGRLVVLSVGRLAATLSVVLLLGAL